MEDHPILESRYCLEQLTIRNKTYNSRKAFFSTLTWKMAALLACRAMRKW